MTSDAEPPSRQTEQPQTPGHVFVIHGRLQDVAHDAVIVPTETSFGVRSGWTAVTGVTRPAPPEGWTDNGFGVMVEPSAGNVWFLDVTDEDQVASPDLVTGRVSRLLEAITSSLREPWTTPTRRRAQHLVALPLLGSGGGGIPSAAMVSELLKTLETSTRDLRVDVAVVVPQRSRFNALQWHRRRHLTTSMDDLARSLGARARDGELALMIGAGVSAGAGLPDWAELIKQVAGRAKGDDMRALLESPEFARLPMLDQAELIQRILGEATRDEIVDAVSKVPSDGTDGQAQAPRPALSHFLLAGLRCQEVATTNYDLLYEDAVRSQAQDGAGHGDIAVLPYDSLKPGHPWILKLHGDAKHREDIVLSRSSFVDYDGARQAVGSLFQAMLMTRHVLFVGLSFTDDNVLRLTHHVTKVRPSEVFGTALALHSDAARERLWQDQLRWVSMEVPDDVSDAQVDRAPGTSDRRTAWQARSLEVFLDRVAMWAVSEEEVLLDLEVSGQDNPLDLTPGQLRAAENGRRWLAHVRHIRAADGR